jgi:hypothetical protein
MSINIRNAYEYLSDNCSTAIAILLTGLLVIGSFGLVFGIYCLLVFFGCCRLGFRPDTAGSCGCAAYGRRRCGRDLYRCRRLQ